MIEVGSREWIRATLALSLGSFLVFLNLYQTHPLLPLLAEVFSVSSLSASWTLAGCTAGLAVSLLICARLADRFGRRRIMLWTLSAAILLSLCIPWVTRFDLLVSLRILQGMLLAGLPATAIAYMGEEFSKRALLSAVGVYIAANSLGGIAGRVVGGLLAGGFGDWQHTFLGIGVISLALLPLVIWLLPAQTRFVAVEAAPGQLRRAIQSHLGNPLLAGAYLIGGLNFMVFLNQYSYLTFLLAKAPFSLPTQWLGMLFLTYLTGTLASSLSGRGAHRWGPQRMLLAG
uniref:MFS transporter n=1 Tax=Aeromonas taiwanensis TaxID=633417 RepID=UPI00248EB8FE